MDNSGIKGTSKERERDSFIHVGYFHTIFEYLLTIFVWVLVPSELVVVPNRTRRALSNALFTSHLRIILCLQDCKNMLKNTENPTFFSKCSPYSLESLFGRNSRWFQVELDELYRMDYLLLRKNVNACLKCQRNAKKADFPSKCSPYSLE